MADNGVFGFVAGFGLWALALCGPALAQTPVLIDGADRPATVDEVFSGLSIWDDGLCEMSYYRATDRVYGKPRTYTRAHLVNRQWMEPRTGVKTDVIASDSVPVFKLNMAEEIPTENYNYRYQATVFVRRPDLAPFKMVVSSQEWCGTTFKHLRWGRDGLSLKTFSYFPNEGDTEKSVSGSAVPYESLFLVARDVAGSGKDRSLSVLPPMRSTHQVEPVPVAASLSLGPVEQVTVPAGRFEARRVRLDWDGPSTSFVVEARAPFRLLGFHAGDVRAELLKVERRAYWDRKWPSAFYETGKAP